MSNQHNPQASRHVYGGGPAEAALRESEEKFRGIVEYANVGIAIVQDARFRFVNPHYAAMLGYTVEELLGTEFMGYCAPEERDRVVGFYTRRARGEPAPPRYETAILHKNGERVYVDVSAGIIPYGGRPATFVFLRDVTEQKQARQALQEAYRALERRVEERKKELATLNAIAAEVNRTLAPVEIIASALEKTMQAIGMECGAAYRLEEADQTLLLLVQRGLSEGFARATARLPLEIALAGKQIREDEPLVWQVAADYPAGELKDRILQEGLQSVVGVPLLAKGQLVGGLILSTRSPRALTADESFLISSIGQQVGIAMDNARLYEAEQERRAEAERRRQVAEGLREILTVLNSKQSLQETLDFIATQACRLMGSDACALLRLHSEGMLRIQAACGLDPEYVAGMRFPPGRGAAGYAFAERRPVPIPNLGDAMGWMPPGDPLLAEPYRTLIERLAEQHPALLSVPILIEGTGYGAITLYYRAPRTFSEEEIQLAVSIADQAALAIESERLRQQAGQAAASEERGRLARELHDSVTQSLYSVTMYAEAAARLLTAGQEATAAEYLRDARDTAQEALREMRLMIYQLRPPLLEKAGLAVALQVRLDAVERRGGIQAELHIEGQERLPPAIQAELHQIAQEALNNALKHAHARRVQVHLHFGQATTCLEIQDDGAGFEPAAARAGGGLGIPGMEERVLKIGGQLTIESAPGQGTKILVEVPTGGGG
jgi:PAS domain S-box-containing protein